VHKLEDDFNRLHGIAGTSSGGDFDDFVLPKPVASKSSLKQVKPHPVRHQEVALSSRRVPPAASRDLSQRDGASSADVSRPTLSCHLCEKAGFPNKKALRYHLFRLHQVPFGRPDSSKAVSSSSSAIPQVLPGRAVAVASPVGVPSPSHSASSFPLVREGVTLLVDFPLTGAVTCTEADCSRQFLAKTWSSAVWSVKKHLRVFHNLPITSSRLRCRMCGSVICKPIKKHACFVDIEPYAPHFSSQWQCDSCHMSFPSALSLRNHLDGHKRAGLRADAPQLSLPISTSKKSRRKRAKHRPTADIGEPSVVHDSNAVLAQPIDQEPLTIDRIVPEDDPPGPLSHFIERLDGLLAGHPSVECFAAFEQVIHDFVNDATVHLFPEGQDKRLPSSSSSSSPPDMEDSATCQKLYRRNRRRAVREITGQSGDRCKIPLLSLQTYFSENWEGGSSDPLLYNSSGASERAELFDTDFSAKEVWEALKKSENSAPGPDRLTYHHLRLVDPGAKLLSRIFNLCLRFQKVPSSWKSSTTILIPKGGDPLEVANWRPIALSCTSYKTFMKCLANRLNAWCERYDVLSFCQKGFRPYDGVLEHNFILQQSIERARSSKKDICIAWLDVTNAFGALPHSALFDSLRSLNVGESLVRLIEDIYHGSTTRILTEEGTSSDIPIKSGVKQGCPLSGLLFNIALDPVIRSLQGASIIHKVLAFADDLCLIASSPLELQGMLDLLDQLMTRLGLHLNPNKSYGFHLQGFTPVGTRDTAFFINNHRLISLREGDFHKFLGKPVGFNAVPNYSSLNDLGELGVKLATSKLTPWQRLDALKAFFYPSLQFPMRTAQFPKGDWAKVDKTILKEVKDTLNLPTEASNDYIYGHRKLGCCGLPIAAGDSDLYLVDTAFKLLSSRDEICAQVALASLVSTVQRRLGSVPNDQTLSDFLSGDIDGPFGTTTNKFSNTWTVARVASRRLGVQWIFEDSVPTLVFQDLTLKTSNRRKVLFAIRDRLRTARTSNLLRKKNQGKAMEVSSLAPASSHFLTDGAFTRFADWRFVHRARLNLVPLNGARPWLKDNDQRCRRCGFQQETLAHVLNHCSRYSHAWQLRHNAIVDRLVAALGRRGEIISCNQTIGGSDLRPDIVFQKGKDVFIIDVTCPFENRKSAFSQARAVIPFFQSQGMSAHIVPILVGALGSWDPENDSFLRRFMSRA
ncbi:retrovirus-related Pol polyprotein from type-2 retrotransposable element R2DM, partial [Caerostris darwini]